MFGITVCLLLLLCIATSFKADRGSIAVCMPVRVCRLRPARIVQVRNLVGYVPQDDIVHEDLTVLENIVLAKNLRGGFKEAKEGHTVVNEVCLPTLLCTLPNMELTTATSAGTVAAWIDNGTDSAMIKARGAGGCVCHQLCDLRSE